VAAAAVEQRATFAATRAPADAPLPSLIVCPATLVAHWPHEIAKFVDPEVLRPLQYHGAPAARGALRPLLASHNVVVMSYETLRADVDWVAGVRWSYCVLDEGHAIRNAGSRVAAAARRVRAQHRLLLSGTPIQNSVLEMWALFDFLMPGFLGGARAFAARYGRAAAASRGAARGSAEAEAGVLALGALHRQVMPFVLRRTKAQVLSDLPPKTVQDVVCEPSALQRALYEDFAGSAALAQVAGALGADATAGGAAAAGAGAPPHVFQALHYLRRLCSHPLLVLDPGVPAHQAALRRVLGPALAEDWPAAQVHLAAHLEHAPKLAALREILVESGIIAEGTGGGGGGGGGDDDGALGGGEDAGGHRALVFAQSRALLDLAERCVLAPAGVASLRIDGGVDPAERFRRAQRFNADPTLGVMLLTTAVGGLGLNLTAADTVVFLEHDWNPQRDLQAMDRAHRLGQRRAVNVYRLLVKGTLEEQVMSLQRFKLDVANAVVNADNVSMAAMDTGNLLELFTLQEGGGGGAAAAGGGGGAPAGAAAAAEAAAAGPSARRGGMAAVLEGLTDPAAAEAQYADEYDLEEFKRKLLGKKG
jgi:TATA-binding protein-associated factor